MADLKVLQPVPTPPTPGDADDIRSLRLDPSLGDGITDTHYHDIAVGKPKDFFQSQPGP